MGTELWMLALSAALCVVLALPYTTGLVLKLGLPVMVGNRENFPQVEGWIGRNKRAHMNLVENLVPFAALVLVAQIGGKLDATTALGAELFFWARLVHAIAYIAGVPWVRTLAYAVAALGMVLIFLRIVA